MFIKDGRYVNLWPEKLDLEDLLYRPLLTRWLPNIFGEFARVFGENRILVPLARAAVFAGSLIGRILSDSLDASVVLLRKTAMRFANFSFALLMTCIGILVILGCLMYYMLP